MKTETENIKDSWKRIFKIIIPYILVAGTFQLFVFLLLGLNIHSPVEQKISTFQFFIIHIFNFLGTVLIVWLFRRYADKESFKGLGFDAKYFVRDILRGLLIGFVIMAAGFLTLMVFDQIQFKLFEFEPVDLILSIGIFIIVALTEELLVRGYVLGNLLNSLNKYVALIVSSAIFSLLHVGNPNINWFAFVDLFLAGVLLGLSYIYTKNLWFPIALHFSWNFFQGTIFGFNVSGIDSYSFINFGRLQNNIWNGGAFGFEGSVLSVMFQLVAILSVFLIFRNSNVESHFKIDDTMLLINSTLVHSRDKMNS